MIFAHSHTIQILSIKASFQRVLIRLLVRGRQGPCLSINTRNSKPQILNCVDRGFPISMSCSSTLKPKRPGEPQKSASSDAISTRPQAVQHCLRPCIRPQNACMRICIHAYSYKWCTSDINNDMEAGIIWASNPHPNPSAGSARTFLRWRRRGRRQVILALSWDRQLPL